MPLRLALLIALVLACAGFAAVLLHAVLVIERRLRRDHPGTLRRYYDPDAGGDEAGRDWRRLSRYIHSGQVLELGDPVIDRAWRRLRIARIATPACILVLLMACLLVP